MNNRSFPSCLLFALVLALAAAPATADTITYQNGASNAFATNYAGNVDTHLDSSNPAFNYGASQSTYYNSLNTIAGLLRFDLSSFAGKYARITSISLSLHVTSLQPSGISGDLTAYLVSAANAGWVAGSGPLSGSTIAGTSTWNHSVHDTTKWAGSPGLSTSVTDYNSTPLGIIHWSAPETYSMNISGTPAELKALVDQWSGTQASNAGLLLRVTSMIGAGSPAFLTAQSTVQQWRPMLTINFTTGPAISVEQPAGTALSDGASTLDFGTSSPGTPASPRTFTIRNDGNATLTGISVSTTGGNSGEFVPAALGATSLAPGASTTFTVTFTPGAAGARATTLQIVSNDAAASPFSVALTGMGFPTSLTKVTPALPAGGVPVGFSPDGTRLIYYTATAGGGNLYSVRVDGSDAAAPVQLNSQPLRLSGSSAETTPVITAAGRVIFTAIPAGTYFTDLFSNSVSGGDLVQLTTGKSVSGKGTDDGIAFPAFLISPDGTKLAFRALDVNFRPQIYTVPVTGGALTQVTSGFANAQGGASTFRWVGNTVIAYRADADQASMYELYVKSADGTGVATKINFNFGAAAPGGTGLNPKVKENFAVSDDGTRLLYLADPTHTVGSSASFPFNLYSAPAGGGTSTQLNPAGSNVQSARNYLVSGPLVAFLASSPATSLYRAPVSPPGGWTGAVLVSSSPYEFRIAPDQTSVVFTTTSAKSDLLQQTGSGAAHVISDTSAAAYLANPSVATRT